MSLTAGARLGPYEIQAAIGAGGMGQIYKARDTRLDRTVAIKILSDALTADPAFRERFEREARLISQLDHPHICPLYDVGAEHGTAFLVMPYLDGQTLAKRLERGALPLGEALAIAVQIASALDRAHRAGIVHRDLKPGNIVLTKAGAKLLDFGLAKTTSPIVTGAAVSSLPTTAPLTGEGTLLGTFQYMAPEQLEGQPADARTDIFAFGAVLYEMLTGRRAFEGKTQASLIAAILEHQPPPPSALQRLTPHALDHVVVMCLAKDPDERWQSAGDLVRELSWVAEQRDSAGVGATDIQRSRGWSLGHMGLVGAAGLAAGAVLALTTIRNDPPDALTQRRVVTRSLLDSAPAERLQVEPFDAGPLRKGRPGRRIMAISPDGATVVFSAATDARQLLYVRQLTDLEAKPIAGTEQGLGPFFSPDGRWIGYYVFQGPGRGSLWKVPREGGPPVKLCDAPPVFGATWAHDDTIIYAHREGGLWRVSATGGMPEQITQPDASKDEYSHRLPSTIPGTSAVLFTIVDSDFPTWDTSLVVVQSLATGERKVLVKGGSDARYVPTGHLAGC